MNKWCVSYAILATDLEDVLNTDASEGYEVYGIYPEEALTNGLQCFSVVTFRPLEDENATNAAASSV